MATRLAENKPGRSSNRLHNELVARILQLLQEQQASAGHRVVEADLCAHFSVSRTPIRSALQLLAERGVLEARPNRGYVLRRPVRHAVDVDVQAARDEAEQSLFVSIARDRLEGHLPVQVTQSELMRRYNVPVALIIKVLRQLASLGVVERKAGHGWSFLPSLDSKAAQDESYELRMVVEPALLLLPKFQLDREWAAETRVRHEHFLHTPWRPTMVVRFYEVNADFHEGLARASQNRYLWHTIREQNSLRRFLNYSWPTEFERVRESVTEHLEILTALEQGKNKLAAALMTRHLENAQ
jgi:DNA-binding GntR family transcriptional regulator